MFKMSGTTRSGIKIMKNALTILAALGVSGEVLRRSIRSAIAAYRAKKSVGNIIADSVEAAIDDK